MSGEWSLASTCSPKSYSVGVSPRNIASSSGESTSHKGKLVVSIKSYPQTTQADKKRQPTYDLLSPSSV